MNKKKELSASKLAEKALKEAVKKALDRHAKMGIPAVIMKNDKVCYRMPDGRIVEKI